jgi:hypothetical protein
VGGSNIKPRIVSGVPTGELRGPIWPPRHFGYNFLN